MKFNTRQGMPLWIMVHHSLTKDNAVVSWGAIRHYHVDVQGWADIGYHAGVELVGDQYEAFIGRPEYAVAAACKEGRMNWQALHVCCVGNYDLAAPPKAMLDVLVERVIVPWCLEYDIPVNRIVAHRDYATYKSCPGSRYSMDNLRNQVTTALEGV